MSDREKRLRAALRILGGFDPMTLADADRMIDEWGIDLRKADPAKDRLALVRDAAVEEVIGAFDYLYDLIGDVSRSEPG